MKKLLLLLAAASLVGALTLPLNGCATAKSPPAAARASDPAAGARGGSPSLNARVTGAASGQTVNNATNTNLY